MNKKINNCDLEKITQQTYDCVAESFSKSRLKKDEIIESFFKLHQPKGRVLDLGCGSGRDLRLLNEQEFFNDSKNSYLGIDYSRELLKLAKENFTIVLRSMKVAKVKYKKMDLIKLNLKEKFDYILALASLHHLKPKNHLLVLRKIQNNLKPGGKFIGYVWSPAKNQIPKWTKITEQEYLKPWNGYNGPKMYIYLFQKIELKNLLKLAGFKNIKIKTVGNGIKKNLFFKATK
ncbi:MAG: class I SAM-dependent methyltransferase [Patescibacteria group bacterium]|nr:class I SAM-dependent methyltransferase [Patescibacteria group bacterium]